MRRVVIFAAVSLAAYVALTVIVLAITAAQGGGVSCVEGNCPPIQDFISDHEPWPLVAAIAASLAAGVIAGSRAS